MRSYCDVLFTQSKPDQEKNTLSPAKCTTSGQNALPQDNGWYWFKYVATPKKNILWKVRYISSLQQNTLTENTRLQRRSSGHVVSRHNIGIFFVWQNQLKLELYFFEVCEDTILVFPCDCVTVLPSIERSKPLFLEREGNPLICWTGYWHVP